MSVAPVIYIFFNRPEITRRTFSVIQKARPSRLYLISDGPRANRPDDVERCRQTRAIVEEMIDWPCEVTRDYATENMGCGRRLSSGLTTAFVQLGEAIVLEDDILPHPDFFHFCTEQLARHRDNPRIHAVNGFNPLGRYAPSGGPVVPSVFNCVWGWASWQRAWKDYDFSMAGWADSEAQKRISRYIGSDLIYHHFAHNFDRMMRERIDTWDFQWSFTLLQNERLALASSVNLIANIGFSPDATHTYVQEPYFRSLKTYPMVPTARIRPLEQPDRIHDKLYSEVILSGSERKIALARFVAQHPLLLSLFRRRFA